MLWVDGDKSSNFLPVKMSMATMWTLAWPCLPVLEVDISTILHGRFLMTTWPFFLKAEHCIGKVVEAPASALSKVTSCYDERNVSLHSRDVAVERPGAGISVDATPPRRLFLTCSTHLGVVVLRHVVQ